MFNISMYLDAIWHKAEYHNLEGKVFIIKFITFIMENAFFLCS